jgi:hypothetical protein
MAHREVLVDLVFLYFFLAEWRIMGGERGEKNPSRCKKVVHDGWKDSRFQYEEIRSFPKA